MFCILIDGGNFQAIHEGLDCKQYQRQMLDEAEDEDSVKTKKWIEVQKKAKISTFRI